MSRLKKLQDRDAAIVGRMKAITDKLAAENRLAMSDGETKEFEVLRKESAEVQAYRKIEEEIAEHEKRLAIVPDRFGADPIAPKEAPKPQIVFKRHGPLKNFKGPNADLNAYRSGQWLRAALWGVPDAIQYCSENGLGVHHLATSSGQASTTNTAGGYLIPDELATTIIDLREVYGVFRRNCRVLPMSSDTLTIARRASGLTAYFVAENNDTTASTKAWDAVTLVAKELAALVRYPITLAEDAIINLADDLAGEIAWAFAQTEDNCGFIGDGTSTYGGMHGAAVRINDGNHAASIYTAATGHTGFDTLTLADFHGVTGKLPLYARPRAAWYVSAFGFANSMERLMYAGGGNTTSTIGGGNGPSFLGYPVVISQVLNATSGADVSAIKLLFGDLSLAATMGSRRELMVDASRERYFEFRQIAIQGSERFDINCHDLGDGTNAGPIVALKTPAS